MPTSPLVCSGPGDFLTAAAMPRLEEDFEDEPLSGTLNSGGIQRMEFDRSRATPAARLLAEGLEEARR